MLNYGETGLIELNQTGFNDHKITYIWLYIETTKQKWTPEEATPLVNDEDGEPPTVAFIDISVSGMLLYLDGDFLAEIFYASNCGARYVFCPKNHELA